MEIFGSWDAIVRAGAEPVEGLGADGVAIVNADDPVARGYRERTRSRVVTFGMDTNADVRAEDVALGADARASFLLRAGSHGARVQLGVPGEHMVNNALAAAACGIALGMRVDACAAALGAARISRWRMETFETASGVLVLNDAYNANPESMAAALKTARWMATGRRLAAVLGHMAELGPVAFEEHERLGELVVRIGVDRLITVGEPARPIARAAIREGQLPHDVDLVRRCGRGRRGGPSLGSQRRRRPAEGLPRRGHRTRGARAARRRARAGDDAVRQILIAAAVGLFVTLLGTPIAIRAFRLWGWGQRIREDGPHTHLEKMGTPTMGGTVIILGIVAGYVVTRIAFTTVTAAGFAVLVATVLLGLLGFVDDYIKVRRRRSLGLSKSGKIVGQAVVAIVFGLLAARAPGVSTDLSFIRATGLDLGVLFYVWVFVILASSSNAVNLTDGLDGLASGSSILVLSGYVFIAFWQFRHTCALEPSAACYPVDVNTALDVAIVAGAAVGATAGFLWWNAAPARIFMGDTGALALGGLIGALAIVTNTQLLLVVLGGLFVIETTSVIVQVISFRGFGRRVFKMSPIHHHFELAGWPEFTVIVRFWIVTGLCVAVGLGLFYTDFVALGGTE